jgi:lipoprotein-anchoring transpeptidase ErfK/SrfK
VTLRIRRRAAAVLVAAAVLLTGCGSRNHASTVSGSTRPSTTTTGTGSGAFSSAPGSSTPAPSSPTPSTSGPRRGSGTAVHVSLYEADGQRYGVAMPIIAFFSVAPTDASVFDQVTQVTVNGAAAHGAWYWERSSQSAYAVEAHYRLSSYWPAHATINVSLPVAGLWAGGGLVFDDSLTLSMRTGPAQLVHVDGTPGVDSMRAYSDGRLVRTLKVSLGAAKTPTYLGTAVVISKANPQLMQSSPGEAYYSIEVPWSVRVTYDGEFLHDAYWNNQLGQVNLSHGCTNLSPADAQWYYQWSQIGDPVTWVHTGTTKVLPVWDGYGDWNLPFSQYARGGLLQP